MGRAPAVIRRLAGGPPLVPLRLRRWVLVLDAAAMACILGLGLAIRVSGRPLPFDLKVERLFENPSRPEHWVAAQLSHAGHPRVFLAITALISLALLLLRDYRAAVTTTLSVGGADVLVEHVVKPLFENPHARVPVFPSGHATVTAALAGAVILAAGRDRPLGRRAGRALRSVLVAVSLLLACAVGLAVIILQMHDFSDVIGGLPLGLSVSASTALFFDVLADRRPGGDTSAPERPRTPEPAAGTERAPAGADTNLRV